MAFLEDYTLLDELGQGGYATVYKVRHNQLGYIRAIRVLKEVIARGEEDPKYQNFLKECRLLLRLGNGNHPNIVHIYQPLLKDQRAIVEMDIVDGKDLFHYLKEQRSFIEYKDVLRLLTDIGSALAYCHEDIYKFCMDKNEDNLKDDPNDGSKVLLDEKTKERLIEKYRVIHNDIHSGNIIRREDGSYVLLDFGLAINGDEIVRSSRRSKGAMEFRAPEKWDNDGILTPQTDIYSFGIVLYEYLTGRVPFLFDEKNSNPTEAGYLLSKAHKEQQPQSVFELRKASFEATHPNESYEQDYPDWMEELIMKCLAKKAEDRFKNGKELYTFVLEHIGDGADAQLQEMKEKIAQLQDKVDSFEELGKKKDASINDLQQQLKEALKQKEELESKLKDLHSDNVALRNQVKNCDNLFAEEGLQKKINDLETDLNVERERLHHTSLKLSDIIVLHDNLQKQNDNLQKQNDSLRKEIEKLRKTPNRSKTPWKVLAIIFMVISVFSFYIIGSESSKQQDEPVIGTDVDDVVANLNSQLEDKNNKIDLLEKEITKLKNYSEGWGTQLEEEFKEFEAEITLLEIQLRDKEKTITSLNNEIDELKKQIKNNTTDGDIENLNSQLRNKEKTITSLNNEIDKLKKQIKDKDIEISALNEILDKNLK